MQLIIPTADQQQSGLRPPCEAADGAGNFALPENLAISEVHHSQRLVGGNRRLVVKNTAHAGISGYFLAPVNRQRRRRQRRHCRRRRTRSQQLRSLLCRRSIAVTQLTDISRHRQGGVRFPQDKAVRRPIPERRAWGRQCGGLSAQSRASGLKRRTGPDDGHQTQDITLFQCAGILLPSQNVRTNAVDAPAGFQYWEGVNRSAQRVFPGIAGGVELQPEVTVSSGSHAVDVGLRDETVVQARGTEIADGCHRVGSKQIFAALGKPGALPVKAVEVFHEPGHPAVRPDAARRDDVAAVWLLQISKIVPERISVFSKPRTVTPASVALMRNCVRLTDAVVVLGVDRR